MVSFFGFSPDRAGPRLRRNMRRVSEALRARGATEPGSAVEFVPAGEGEIGALAVLVRLGVVVEVRPGLYYHDGDAAERRASAHLGCMRFFLLAFGAMGILFLLAVAFVLWTFMNA
jgi:hypothetical protein